MKKVFKFITQFSMLMVFFVITSFNQAYGQLGVSILYNGFVVNPINGCQGVTTTLNSDITGGSGDYTYTWNCSPANASFIPSDDAAFFLAASSAGTFNVSLDVLDNLSGFTGSATVTVVINPKPLSNIIATGPTTFCQGGSVELDETNSQLGVNYQWLKGGVSISGATNDKYSATATGSYRVKVSYNSTGCFQNSNAINVTVNPLPAATASSNSPVCYNGTINLTSGPDGMVSYSWTSTSTTPFTSTLQNPSITNATPNNSGNYTVTVTDGNSCVNNATTIVLVYNDNNGGVIASDQSICYNGDPAAFTNTTSPSGGDNSWTYSWESKVGAGAWTAISGANAITYDAPLGLTQTTQYRRAATNGCATVYSNTITVTVYSAMDGGTIAADQSICYNGNPAAFTNTLSPSGGNGAWTYSWESKVGIGTWTTISGATAITYDAPAGLTQTTDYRRLATNSCGTVYSNTVTVTVYTAQDAGVIAADQSICYNGDPAAFTSTTDPSGGNGAWTYSWESKVGAGAWTAIAGTNVLAYDVPAGLTQTTLYRRAATNACGTVYSNSITVTVYAALNGGTISGDQSLCYNSDPANITSTTGPSGGNGAWTYSWESQTNCSGAWTAIAGANGLTYDPPANQTTTLCYRRASTNSCGTIYSNTVTITIYANIDGGVIASDQTVCSGGDPLAFTNTTSPSGGNGAWTYAWESKVGAGAWTAISGATALTYNVPAGITQTTQYRRGATNSCGTGYSNTITVTVSNAVDGGTIGTDKLICYNGDPAAFTDVVSPSGGSGAWTYAWESKVGAGAWTAIAGANAITYDVPAGLTQTTQYHRISTNACGSGTSNAITVTVYADVSGGTIAASQNVCYNGDPAAFTSTLDPSGGNGTWTYSWESRIGAGAWTAISGANALTYDVSSGITQTTDYRRVATGFCGTVNSNVVTLTVYSVLDGGVIAVDQSVCNGGDPVAFTSTTAPSGGNGAFTYSWESKFGAGAWTPISGATAITYDVSSGITQTTLYRRAATNLCGTLYSNTLTITVYAALSGGSISANQTICYNGDPDVFTNTTSPSGGNGTWTYFWESRVGAGAWTAIAGASALTYDPPAGLTVTTQYRRGATNSCGTVYSNTQIVTVYATVAGGTIAASQNICYNGDPAAFTSTTAPSGGNGTYTYTWESRVGAGAWMTIAGATAITYDVAAGLTQTTDYRRVATTSCGTAYSNLLTITVTAELLNNTITADQTICSSSTPALLNGSLPTGGTGTYTYQWQSSTTGASGPFSDVSGATSQNYQPGSLTQSTWYQRVVNSGVCSLISGVVAITVNPPIANNTISSAQSICYNSTPALLTGTLPTGGNGTYTYQWQQSNVGVGGPFTDIVGANSSDYQPGALTQTTWFRRNVTSLPCTDNQSNVIAVTVGSLFTVTCTTTSPLCVGSTNATVTANPVGGTSPYTYSWNTTPVQSSKTATGLLAGTYTVTVTDNIGCTVTGTATVSDPTPLTLGTPTITNVIGCYGEANGSIQIQAAGGTPSYTYSFYDNNVFVTSQTQASGTPAKFTGLDVGTLYEIRVVDANNCGPISSGILVITQPSQLTITNVATTPISCNGDTDATITIDVAGGTGLGTYFYSITGPLPGGTFQSGNVFSVGQGVYDITVMDANSCETSWPVQIEFTNPPKISFNYQVFQINTCNGKNDGKIEIKNVSGGSGSGYEYSIYQPPVWGNDPVFNNLPGGIVNPYYVRVKDSNGCIETANSGNMIIINQPALITFNIVNIINVTGCWYSTNGSFRVQNLVGGTGALRVSINGTDWYGAPHNFINIAVGTYTVTARDVNGCIVTQNVSITGPAPIVLDAPPTTVPVLCNGSSNGEIHATASGGTGTLTYSIDGVTYQTDGNFTSLAAGTYTLTVKDNNDCILSQSVTIIEPASLVFSSQLKTDITCNGLTDGTITLAASGGTPPYSYSITGGIPFGNLTGLFTGLAAGTYSDAVMDSHGCITIGSTFKVVDPPALTLGLPIVTSITCFGKTDGIIQVTAAGGNSPYTYTLYDAGMTVIKTNSTGLFSDLSKGNYIVDVKDANGCGPVPTGVLTIDEPIVLSYNTFITDLGCHGDASGEILFVASGGTPPYEYSIDGGLNFNSNNNPIGLAAGTYNLVVHDNRGCEQSSTVTIIEPAELLLTLNGFDIKCNGDLPPTGMIVATTTGGTTPVQFRIDGGTWQASGTFNNVSAGMHTVDVLDANGCTKSKDIKINQPTPIVLGTPVPVNPTCKKLGSITATATGGTGTLVYTLNPGAISNITGQFDGVGAGVYNISVTDDNLCGSVSTAPITLTSPSLISIDNIPIISVTGCYGGTNGQITILASGGTGTLKYSIDGGANYQPSNIFTNVSGGNYTVVVNDDADCPQSQLVFVGQPDQLVVTTIYTQISAAGANDGTITATVSGGTPNYTYTLQPIGTILTPGAGLPAIFSGLSDGTYTVQVTDANSCTIVSAPPIVLSGMSVTLYPHMVSCFGKSDGHIGVLPQGGTPSYTILCIQLPGNITMPDTINLPAGDYLISVTDNAGKNIQKTVTITQPNELVASFISATNPDCFGGTDGSVSFNITGGTAPYTITWTGGGPSTGTVATNVASGTHDFIITDSNGCSNNVNGITLTDPEKLNISNIVKVDLLCNGIATGSITVIATGGTGTLVYKITGPVNISNNTGVFNNLPAGDYTIGLTDANLCVAFSDISLNVTLTEPTPISVKDTHSAPLTCPNVPDGFIDLTVSGGTPGYTYLWSNLETTEDLDKIICGDYSVTIMDANGCKLDTAVTLLGPEKFGLDSTINMANCYEHSNLQEVGGIEITDTHGGTGSFLTIPTDNFVWDYIKKGETEKTKGHILSGVSSGRYNLTVTDIVGCVYGFSYYVPYNPDYYLNALAVTDSTICYGSSIKLIADPQGPELNLTYKWDEIMNDGSLTSIGSDTSKIVSPLSETNYRLTIYNYNEVPQVQCYSEDTVTIGVYPQIGLNIPLYISAVEKVDTLNVISILSGKSYNMDAITESTAYPTKFKWEPKILFDSDSSWNSSIYFDDALTTQLESRKRDIFYPRTKRVEKFYWIDVVATTSVGCKDSINLYAKLVDKLAFGNVFSPNGDGLNDIWRVPKDYLFPDLEIEIFNRWGSMVWSAKGDEAAKGWDGRTNKGNELPIGTYYYVVKFNIKTSDSNWKPITGSITIVR